MFDRTVTASWDERSRRGLTTLASFGLQAAGFGILLILPLLRPQGLPSFHEIATPVSWGQVTEPHVTERMRVSHSAPATNAEISFRQPTSIPRSISVDGDAAPPQFGNSEFTIPGIPRGDPNGVRNLIESGSRPILPTIRSAPLAPPIRVSHMSEGNLLWKVQPAYPALARSARIQGAVILQAMISKDGLIENLRLASGHPMLVPAALEAVKQWRYHPYILNGEAVEVETQITVNFSLAGN